MFFSLDLHRLRAGLPVAVELSATAPEYLGMSEKYIFVESPANAGGLEGLLRTVYELARQAFAKGFGEAWKHSITPYILIYSKPAPFGPGGFEPAGLEVRFEVWAAENPSNEPEEILFIRRPSRPDLGVDFGRLEADLRRAFWRDGRADGNPYFANSERRTGPQWQPKRIDWQTMLADAWQLQKARAEEIVMGLKEYQFMAVAQVSRNTLSFYPDEEVDSNLPKSDIRIYESDIEHANDRAVLRGLADSGAVLYVDKGIYKYWLLNRYFVAACRRRASEPVEAPGRNSGIGALLQKGFAANFAEALTPHEVLTILNAFGAAEGDSKAQAAGTDYYAARIDLNLEDHIYLDSLADKQIIRHEGNGWRANRFFVEACRQRATPPPVVPKGARIAWGFRTLDREDREATTRRLIDPNTLGLRAYPELNRRVRQAIEAKYGLTTTHTHGLFVYWQLVGIIVVPRSPYQPGGEHPKKIADWLTRRGYPATAYEIARILRKRSFGFRQSRKAQ